MTTTALGNRQPNLFFGADITLRRVSTGEVQTVHLSNKGWITNPYDSVAPNRQYKGLLIDGYDYSYSWFHGDALGGAVELNRGLLRAINPDGPHSLDWIFSGGWVAQSIVHRMGEIGEDLGAMITRTTACSETRPSSDSHTIEIDLTDDAQELDTSLFIDKMQGLGSCVRCFTGDRIKVPDHADLDPSTAWYLHVAYRLPPWATLNSTGIAARPASGGEDVCRLELRSDGKVRIRSRTATDSDVTLDATDLPWVADGRWHHLVGKWDGAVLSAFHSTRRGGAKSAITAAQTTIKAGDGDLLIGDMDEELGEHDWLDVAMVAFAVDGNVPTDAEILARLKRCLNDDEITDCEVYLALNENTGSAAADGSGNGHTATIEDDSATPLTNRWRPGFDGRPEMAGQAKPVAFGHVPPSAPIVWTNQENGEGLLHSRCYKGVEAAFEGGERLVIGWPKRKFYSVTFDNATKTISFAPRESPAGVDREEAQPGFSGIGANQVVNISGSPSNDGALTAVSSTIRSITVDAGDTLVDEGPVDCFIEVLDADGGDPDVQLWHDSGGVWYGSDGIPEKPATFEVLGDIGAEVPTDDADTHWPEYVPAILRTLLRDWGGQADIADNWDVDPANPIGAYWAEAGKWFDPARDRTILDAMAEGASGIWSRFGQEQDSDTWDFEINRPPQGTAELQIGALENIGLRRIRSVPPVGGLALRGALNERVLEADEFVAVVEAADREALARPYLEATAAIDANVAAAYPAAKTPDAITTWLRHFSDIQVEAQRQYDALKVDREVFELDVVLYGLDSEPLRDELEITDSNFPTLAAGKDFYVPQLKAKDERVTLTGWG